MRQIFQYKSKHILYNTWRVEEKEEEKKDEEQKGEENVAATPSDDAETRAKKNAEDANLTDDQLSVVLASMSDNRISDSVKSLVEQNS